MTATNPFAGLPPKAATSTAAPAKKAAAPKKEKPVATAKTETPAPAIDTSDPLGYLLSQMGGTIELSDEDFEAPAAFTEYKMPADGEWVPLRIVDATIVARSMNIVLNPEAEPIVPEPVEIPRFELELEHMATVYGTRFRPYLLGVPFQAVWIAKRSGGVFKKNSGNRLLAATGALQNRQQLQLAARDRDSLIAELTPLAAAMNGTIVMARIRHITKENSIPVPLKDEAGNFIYDESSGEIKKEFKVSHRIYDNLADDVAPVPGRKIVIKISEDESVEAEITWNTIARIVQKPIALNTLVVAVDENGKEYTARWAGDEGWVLHRDPQGNVLVPGADIFTSAN